MGSGEEVAEYLIHLLDETDIDGFNLTRTVAPESHHDFIRLVIPELQQRGRYKTAYKTGSLRNKIFNRVITYQNSTLFKRSDVVPITTAKLNKN